jgi:hypothetical protein
MRDNSSDSFQKFEKEEDLREVFSTQSHKGAKGAECHKLQRLHPNPSDQSTLSQMHHYW